QPLSADDDLGVLGRIGGGVVQQLGQKVADVVGGHTGEGCLWQLAQADPGIVLDLGCRGAGDVEQGDDLVVGVGLTAVVSGQHQEVLPVASHTGREVVDLEEFVEQVGILGVGLQGLDHLQQGVDQGQVTHGQS